MINMYIWNNTEDFSWIFSHKKFDFLLNFKQGSVIHLEFCDKHFELDNLCCSGDPRSSDSYILKQH